MSPGWFKCLTVHLIKMFVIWINLSEECCTKLAFAEICILADWRRTVIAVVFSSSRPFLAAEQAFFRQAEMNK
jgi:hypothetical protein